MSQYCPAVPFLQDWRDSSTSQAGRAHHTRFRLSGTWCSQENEQMSLLFRSKQRQTKGFCRPQPRTSSLSGTAHTSNTGCFLLPGHFRSGGPVFGAELWRTDLCTCPVGQHHSAFLMYWKCQEQLRESCFLLLKCCLHIRCRKDKKIQEKTKIKHFTTQR